MDDAIAPIFAGLERERHKEEHQKFRELPTFWHLLRAHTVKTEITYPLFQLMEFSSTPSLTDMQHLSICRLFRKGITAARPMLLDNIPIQVSSLSHIYNVSLRRSFALGNAVHDTRLVTGAVISRSDEDYRREHSQSISPHGADMRTKRPCAREIAAKRVSTYTYLP